MARIRDLVGTTFSEYNLLPGYTPKSCNRKTIKLETKLAGIPLGLPFLSAAMTSVTGYEMTLALSRQGGLGVLPVNIPDDEASKIIRTVKDHSKEQHFIDDPVTVSYNGKIRDALELIRKFGHSHIPVIDQYRTLKGVFDQQIFLDSGAHDSDPVTEAMQPFENMAIITDPELTSKQAKKFLSEKDIPYVAVVDKDRRLVKLSFRKDTYPLPVAAAITTHPGWQDRAHQLVESGVDLIVVDTSDGFSEYMDNLVVGYKQDAVLSKIPLCVGNVVTYEAAKHYMELGADLVKGGMSTGSICTTRRVKATGRSPMSTLSALVRAQEHHLEKHGRRVPIIYDGGVSNSADMIIALTHADAIMMGGYFNRFFEAAGPKLDQYKHRIPDPANHEQDIRYVESWGEGSARAKNLGRYDQTERTFFEEGIEGVVPYRGFLKPNVRLDVMIIKKAMENVGAHNLQEFREKAQLEYMSQAAQGVVGNTHNVEGK